MQKEKNVDELILKTMRETMNNPKMVTLDDKATLGCNQCGMCCFNRGDILLKPLDLYNISKYLELSIEDFLYKYCEIYLGSTSGIPTIRIQPEDIGLGVSACPFLKPLINEKDFKAICSINKVKPTVCRMYPVGRANSSDGDVKYLVGEMDCVEEEYKKEVRIGDWINEELENKASKTLQLLINKINKLYEIVPAKDLLFFFDSKDEELKRIQEEFFMILIDYLYAINLKLPIDEAIEDYGQIHKNAISTFEEIAKIIKLLKE